MIAEEDEESDLRAVVVGEYGVGKTCILSYFVNRSFQEDVKSTVTPSHSRVVVQTPHGSTSLTLWDTAGTEKYQSLIPFLSRTADGIILCFSVTEPKSFENVLNWLNIATKGNEKDPIVLLLGNKVDLVTEVDQSAYQEFAEKHNMIFFLTSAKTGENVVEAIQELVDRLVQKNKSMVKPVRQDVNIEVVEPQKKKCC